MGKNFIMGIKEIVSGYVDEVAGIMLIEARILCKCDWFVELVESFYKRFQEEQAEYEQEVNWFFTADTDRPLSLASSVLTHSKSYRQVISDILLNKVDYK